MLIQLVDAILAVHIATIVRQNLVVVAKVNQRIQQVAVAPRFCRAEDAGTDLRQRLVELFILLVILVPEASVPAREICSDRSAAGMISCARLTL